jgi:hypothetical protein
MRKKAFVSPAGAAEQEMDPEPGAVADGIPHEIGPVCDIIVVVEVQLLVVTITVTGISSIVAGGVAAVIVVVIVVMIVEVPVVELVVDMLVDVVLRRVVTVVLEVVTVEVCVVVTVKVFVVLICVGRKHEQAELIEDGLLELRQDGLGTSGPAERRLLTCDEARVAYSTVVM